MRTQNKREGICCENDVLVICFRSYAKKALTIFSYSILRALLVLLIVPDYFRVLRPPRFKAGLKLADPNLYRTVNIHSTRTRHFLTVQDRQELSNFIAALWEYNTRI